MRNPEEINRRIKRQENEVVDIHDILKEIRKTQKQHGEQIAQLDGRITKLDEKFDARFTQLDEKFEVRFTQLDAKFDQVLALLTKGGGQG